MFKRIFRALDLLIALAFLIVFTACDCNKKKSTVNCSRQGSSSIFVANFENDITGSLPAPSTPLHYGPPGASLNTQDGLNTIQIVNPAAIGSKALRITRGSQNPTEIEMVVGDNGDAPYNSGVYYIRFKAYGEVVPDHLIAGVVISAVSATGQAAFMLKLYNTSYHYREEDSFFPLNGSYDPGVAHMVYIELDLDKNTYSICIDEQVVANNRALLTQNFGDLSALKFFAPPTITEAFEMVYVIDDIRITK